MSALAQQCNCFEQSHSKISCEIIRKVAVGFCQFSSLPDTPTQPASIANGPIGCYALHLIALHCATLHCGSTLLHRTTALPQCTALLHCTALRCSALRNIALPCTALHYTELHYIALQFIALRHIAMRLDTTARHHPIRTICGSTTTWNRPQVGEKWVVGGHFGGHFRASFLGRNISSKY